MRQSAFKRHSWRLMLVLLLQTMLIGCGGGESLDELQPGDTILAFGDSLTFGKGVEKSDAYPAVLEQLSGFSVVNAGVSGETTAEGRGRLPGLLAEYDPALVILFEGGNDILQNLSKSRAKMNLDQMILDITASDAQAVLVAVPEKSLFSSAASWYAELAEEHGLVLQGDIVAKLIKRPAMKSDSVHFNADGYRALAKSIHDLLDDNGAY